MSEPEQFDPDRLCGRFIRKQWRFFLTLLFFLFFMNIAFLMQLFHVLQMDESEALSLESVETPAEVDRQPKCDMSENFGLSVFKRMKTERCRRKLEDHVCKMDRIGWPVRAIKNTCRKFNISSQSTKIGCYADSTSKRTLNFFMYDLPGRNTPMECIQHCFRIGAQLAGVEYGRECFCGMNKDIADLTPITEQGRCDNYTCSGDSSLFCGGYNSLTVYSTGVQDLEKAVPAYVPVDNSTSRDVKILFLLQLNGRNVRQIKRLLKAIYNPRHLYVVHVDSRQQLMHAEMKEVQATLEKDGRHNFKVMDHRFITIWGGTSLLDMFLYVVNDTLKSQDFHDWDYIFNLSESDYPVLSLEELEAILTKNKGTSFLSAHGYNTGSFLKKQGYNYHFFECEERMWRVGARTNYPHNVRMDGGSDWVILHRDFAKFGVSNAEISVQMRELFSTILLPLEGYFHTLALNTEFCDRVQYRNLRLTNWKRDQGCRCEALKPVVDWCGCSPVALKHDDSRLKQTAMERRPSYFARKFDTMVDSKAIALAEQLVYKYDLKRYKKSGLFHDAWINFYDNRFDRNRSDAEDLNRMAVLIFDKVTNTKECKLVSLQEVTIYVANEDQGVSSVFKLVDTCGLVYEAQVRRTNGLNILHREKIVGNFRLHLLEYGLELDLKEEIFRNELSLIHDWSAIQPLPTSGGKVKTSPKVFAELYDKDKHLVHKVTVLPYNSIYYNQHVSFDFKIHKIAPGRAHLVLRDPDSNQQLHSIYFFVFPREINDRYTEMFHRTYHIMGHCHTPASPDFWPCERRHFSTFLPDPRTDILHGFNETANSLF